MAISDQLTLLNNTKTAIRNSINSKGGSVSASDTFASYATAIDNLPSGGDNSTLIDLIEGDITTLNIPSGTTKIGQSAFQNYTTLASVTIPSSVTSIGNNAFQNCTSLASINIPSGVTTIGNNAFQSCSKFTSVIIPDSVTTIGNSAFNSCSLLTSINIPSGVTTIGNNVFQGCTSLASINIPSGVTTIGGGAFYNCSKLTSVTIPSGVTSIEGSAFYNCSKLTSVTVNAITPPTLGYNVFTNTNNCPIYVPAESVNAYKAASQWSNYASRIYPIQQVATVDGNPVYNYDLGMTSTDTITSENMAKMPAGTNLELAEGITWAGGATAFSNYTNLTLPSTFATFGDQNMLDGLTTVTSKATTPPSAERNQIGGSSLTAIYVPAASVDTYKAAGGWSTHSSIIQAIPS